MSLVTVSGALMVWSVEKNEVAGQGGFDSDGCRLLVPHFPDHDHIGVEPQETPHDSGEIQTDLGSGLHLSQALLGDFDGVLRSPDFYVGTVQVTQGGREASWFFPNRWDRQPVRSRKVWKWLS